MITMSIGRKISTLVLLLFMASLFNSYFIFELERDGNEKLSWVNRTNEVLLESEKLLGFLRDAETGQRGYLLTHDASYLAPYHNALPLIDATPQQLSSFLNAKPKISRSTLKRKSISNWPNWHKPSLAQRQGFDQALQVVTSRAGQSYMEDIRNELRQLSTMNW